jgi:polysaccharide export outer membrane protein
MYFQEYEKLKEQKKIEYEPIIKLDDLINIDIYSVDEDLTKPFNKHSGSGAGNTFIGYLVDHNGFIDFPVLGKIKVDGLSKSALKKLFENRLSQYIKDPVVDIRIGNFRVSVLGEKAAVLTFETDRLSLHEFLAKLGDLPYTARRDNVLIVREVNGIKTFNKVDVRQASIINSPFYYMAQDDVVYIEPKRNKVDTDVIPRYVTNLLTIGSLILTTLLLIKNTK